MATKLGQNVIFFSPPPLGALTFGLPLCVWCVSCMESFDPVCPLQTATAFNSNNNNNNSSHLNKYVLIQQAGAVFQTRGQI